MIFIKRRHINITNNDSIKATLSNGIKDNSISSYECSSDSCKIIELNESRNEVLIYDNGYLTYNYVTEDVNNLNIVNKIYESINYRNNYILIKDNNKYALYDVDNNDYINDIRYDGISTKEYEGSTISLFINDSKYNQILDIYKDNEIIKTYKYCNSLKDNSDNGYCSEHVDGNITNQEVDSIIDTVKAQYPDLNDVRLFTIKTGIETVGLPYFWGGGHLSLAKTLETATKTWNNEMCVVGGKGFKNQIGGQEYPCGFDCSGFVRWVYYTATGIDIMGDGVSVIGGRNRHPQYTQITEDELLPGDLIMDKDHVVIYLYKNEDGKHISVHAAFDHLKVEVSNYKRGNEYFRLNAWNE